MNYEDISIDELLADVSDLLDEKQQADPAESAGIFDPADDAIDWDSDTPIPKKHRKKNSGIRKFWGVMGKILLVILETALMLALALYGVMYIVAKGPSTTARDLFVMSVRETSAVGFVANIFFTDEEIAQIEKKGNVEDYIEVDTSLIQIPKETQSPDMEGTPENQAPVADAWGLIDEDGDGIIVKEVKGEGYSGYMMVVLDPSRVIVGSVPGNYGAVGYTVEQMVKRFDAVAGTNAGGFDDPEGKGNGSIPDTMVVFDGKVYYAGKGTREGFVGFDSNHIMHVATRITEAEIKEKDIRYGICFGPVLIANGEPVELGPSGINPRTAIGQRSDGAVLMLVIDGRQVISMGATHQDLVDIMLDFGAVNACNLDGGSSSLMWYQDRYVNNCASVIGIRPVPTTILVLKKGDGGNG